MVLLSQPLWLEGLHVEALLALLAQRPKEFVIVERVQESATAWQSKPLQKQISEQKACWTPSLRPKGSPSGVAGSGGGVVESFETKQVPEAEDQQEVEVEQPAEIWRQVPTGRGEQRGRAPLLWRQ